MNKVAAVISITALFGLLAQTCAAEDMTPGSMAPGTPVIPPQFQGAGCNMKYVYAKTPKEDASECLTYWVKDKGVTAHNGDNFIRIGQMNVNGVDWGCTVREIKTSTKTEFKFVGGCSSESSEFDLTVTLTLKPGNFIVVDTLGAEPDAAHVTDKYHILPGLK